MDKAEDGNLFEYSKKCLDNPGSFRTDRVGQVDRNCPFLVEQNQVSLDMYLNRNT